MKLPTKVQELTEPVFARLPRDIAMAQLISPTTTADARAVVANVIPNLTDYPALIAALWLWADDLDACHDVAQNISSLEGAFWHGMMHRREGDFSNAKYWFRMAGALPRRLGLDPAALTDEVARHHRDNPIHLVEAQRREWETLFEHCAGQSE